MSLAAPPAAGREIARTAVIRLIVRKLEDGGYLARSPDVPGLLAQAETFDEAVSLAGTLTWELADFWNEVGQAWPPALRDDDAGERPLVELTVPVGLPPEGGRG